jgi:hypothetical protein
MAESDILQYTVDLDSPGGDSQSGPTAYGGFEGPYKRKDPLSKVLLIAIAVLIIIILAVAWRWMYRSKPDCGRYKGGAGGACRQLSQACEDDPRCLNAVAHCMPVFTSGSKGHIDAWGLSACSRAIRNMSPRFVARQLAKRHACLPAGAAALAKDRQLYSEARAALKAAAPLLPYALDVAHELPACPRT